jgi:hypothetical protein
LRARGESAEGASSPGYDPKVESANFGPVWRGGEWKLRDITNTMTTAAFFLLKHAAQNREHWLQRFYEIGKEAVRPRKNGELFGFVFNPPSETLRHIFEHAEVSVGAIQRGYLVRMDQPYAAFGKAVLEAQHYPDLRDQKGNPVQPYDVTAHTLSLLLNTNATPVFAPFTSRPARWGISGADYGLCTKTFDRNALYKSHVPSMDEGWTRWVLENERDRRCVSYSSLLDAEVRAASLRAKYDTIIIPDQSRNTILNGHRKGAMPEEYTGGLGEQGVKALREFVEQGGTLICLNRASDFAIEQFKLPVRNVVDGLPRTEFYVPGSILRIELKANDPITKGMPKESIAWVENSPVFEVLELSTLEMRVIAWYPKDKDPLLSGWLLGGDRIKGKAALVEVGMGKGRIILFGFRPQYRGQSLATYPLFFNAITQD